MKQMVLFLVLAIGIADSAFANPVVPVSIVRHRWQEKITESNHAALRPGSIYDINTYFEEGLGLLKPKFNYFFYDTGLGATDPIYPVFQTGTQRNWAQLIKSGLGEKHRHIDHQSVGQTPEGCEIRSTYWVRHVSEFPELYAQERADGYSLVDISFDYYVKLRPDAQCGKHFAHEASENFDAFKEIDGYADKFRTFADIPPALLAKYEAKVGILKLVTEEFSLTKWPRYDEVYSLRENSMWFYPDGFAPDYGISEPRPQPDLSYLDKPRHLVMDVTDSMRKELPLLGLMGGDGWKKFQSFLNGKPRADFDESEEPGNDTLKLADVTPKNFYTSGTDIFPITTVQADVGDPAHFKLVSAVVRPYEPESDIHFHGLEKTSQLRFIFQMMSPDGKRPYEQLYVHLIFDAVDRDASPEVRTAQMQYFLRRLDKLAEIREKDKTRAEAATMAFFKEFTQRPVQTIAFSSSLTGIWVFGNLTRSYNKARELEPMRIVRSGIDVGYYSTAYDTVLFRDEIKTSSGARKAELEKILADLTPEFYRDPRRHDANTLTFHRVTCAQCHQMAGRDGVHMALNDHLDRRVTTPYRATEYLFRELDRQLKGEEPAIGSR